MRLQMGLYYIVLRPPPYRADPFVCGRTVLAQEHYQ